MLLFPLDWTLEGMLSYFIQHPGSFRRALPLSFVLLTNLALFRCRGKPGRVPLQFYMSLISGFKKKYFQQCKQIVCDNLDKITNMSVFILLFLKWQSYLSQPRAGRHSFLLLATTASPMSCWSASPPPSAAGAQQDTLHITGTARLRLQATLTFIYLQFLCVCLKTAHTVCFFFCFVCLLIFYAGLGHQAARRSLASPTQTQEIPVLFRKPDCVKWSRQVRLD